VPQTFGLVTIQFKKFGVGLIFTPNILDSKHISLNVAPEVSELRGVNSTAVIRTLLERRMIRVSGRKEVVGSPFLYRTTREFLVHFGLNDIRDLPRLEEFGDLIGETINEDVVAAINAAPEPDYSTIIEEPGADIGEEVELESAGSEQHE